LSHAATDIFSPDANPDVVSARERYDAAHRAARIASRRFKRRREIQLQDALHALMRAEAVAVERDQQPAQTQRDDTQHSPISPMPRESGDDTNYRPYARKI